MSVTIEHEIGGWTIGQALATDCDEAGPALVAMAQKINKMPRDERVEYIEGIRYQFRKCSSNEAELVKMLILFWEVFAEFS